MVYSTDFMGRLKLSRSATENERDYINLISDTRRMKRDVKKLMSLYNGKHGNPFAIEDTPEAIYGEEGEYFTLDNSDSDSSIIDYNCSPGEQPGLWCQWVITDDCSELEWNGGEKFYDYIEWLKYLIVHFFETWNIKLNGEIE